MCAASQRLWTAAKHVIAVIGTQSKGCHGLDLVASIAQKAKHHRLNRGCGANGSVRGHHVEGGTFLHARWNSNRHARSYRDNLEIGIAVKEVQSRQLGESNGRNGRL